MKTTKLLGIITCSLLTTTVFSQSWLPGGNPLVGVNAVTPANNSLGTNGNVPILFETNGINRMQLTQDNTATINGFTVNNSGFLGLSVPLAATLLSQKLTSADASIPSAL